MLISDSLVPNRSAPAKYILLSFRKGIIFSADAISSSLTVSITDVAPTARLPLKSLSDGTLTTFLGRSS